MYLKLSYGTIEHTTEFITSNSSYKLEEVYYNDLSHADNSCSVKIPFNVDIQNFINTYSDNSILAQIKETNGTNIFTGYVRKNYDFSKAQKNQALSLELVSPSFLLDVDTTQDITLENTTLDSVVNALLADARFSTATLTSLSVYTISIFTLDEGSNIKKTLDNLLQQYGFTFDFDKDGNFYVATLFSDIPTDKTTITQIFDGTNSIDEIKVEKKEQEYNGVNLGWIEYKNISNKLIFADTTNGSASENTCSIELQAGKYLTSGNDDDTGTSYYIAYDSSEGDIIYIDSATLTLESSNNSGLTYSFTNLGKKGELSIYNKSSATITITKINVNGSGYVAGSENQTKTTTGKKFRDIAGDYIHDSTNAKKFAQNYCDWQNYADYKISLKSNSDFALGSFAKITEYGLGILYGRIIGKVYKLNSPIEYKIEAISDYEKAETTDYYTQNYKQGIAGADGKDGDTGATGATGARGSLQFIGTEIDRIYPTEITYSITTNSTGITSSSMAILVGDTYLNSITGDLFKCTTAGTPTTSKWVWVSKQSSNDDDSNIIRFFTPTTPSGSNSQSESITVTAESGTNPFGVSSNILKISRSSTVATIAYSSYRPYDKSIKIDPTKNYRYVCYVKANASTKITNYYGVQRWYGPNNKTTLYINGVHVDSSYCTYSKNNFGYPDEWILIVSYITANGTSTTPDSDYGIYRMATKQKISTTITNYQWQSGITNFMFDGNQIEYTDYAFSGEAGTTYIYDMRLDVMDGTQPTIEELLNQDTSPVSKGNWASGTNYFVGNIVYYSTNKNSYVCIKNNTSSGSILPTNTTYWNLVSTSGATGATGATGSRGAQYKGASSSAPTSNIVSGDYYLNTTNGYLYYYSGSSWVSITDYSDDRYISAMNDMINLSSVLENEEMIKATNIWVTNLVAGTALITELFSKEITVENLIKSSNYSDGLTGFKIGSDGRIDANKLYVGNLSLDFDNTLYNLTLASQVHGQTITGKRNLRIGFDSQAYLTTGNENISIGVGAGNDNVTGSGNIMIGAFTTGNSTDLSHEINLGNRLQYMEFSASATQDFVYHFLDIYVKYYGDGNTSFKMSCIGSFNGNELCAVNNDNDGNIDFYNLDNAISFSAYRGNKSTLGSPLRILIIRNANTPTNK